MTIMHELMHSHLVGLGKFFVMKVHEMNANNP